MNFFSVTAPRTHALRLTIWKVLCYMQVCEVGTLVGIFWIAVRRHVAVIEASTQDCRNTENFELANS